MKHSIFAYLVVSAATLLFIPSASATWSGFRSLGTTKVVGKPSCAQLSTSEVMCVARSQLVLTFPRMHRVRRKA
jgi:hypothetical protein